MNVFTQKTKDSVVKSEHSSESGVALLFVILLTSVLLLVSLGIANIAYKEQTFSLEARDSNKAFFAADTGIECALLFDKQEMFSDTALSSTGSCFGHDDIFVSSSGTGTRTFFDFVVPQGRQCALVKVDTEYPRPTPTDPDATVTQIASYGYNINNFDGSTLSCVSTLTPASRVVTRVLTVQFPN